MRRVRSRPLPNILSLGFVLRGGWRGRIVLIAVVCLVVLGMTAAEPPVWIPGAISPTDAKLRDLELLLRARKALLQEKTLSDLNLGVSVSNRIANLWGTVPSVEISRKAEEHLRLVVGLAGIRNQIRVSDNRDALLLVVPLPKRAPLADPVVALPPRVQESLARRPNEHGRAPAQPTLWRPARRRTLESEPVRTQPGSGSSAWIPAAQVPIIPPSPGISQSAMGESTPSTSKQSVHGLAQAIEAIRNKDERFDRLQVEIRGGVVSLQGHVYRWEHARDLARAISRLPGVERVLLDKVRASTER